MSISFVPAVTVDGQWQEWSPWSQCSVTCSNGTQQRSRQCTAAAHGGSECRGPWAESRECYNPECTGEYLFVLCQLMEEQGEGPDTPMALSLELLPFRQAPGPPQSSAGCEGEEQPLQRGSWGQASFQFDEPPGDKRECIHKRLCDRLHSCFSVLPFKRV